MASPPWKVEIFVSSPPPRDEGPDQGHPDLRWTRNEKRGGKGWKQKNLWKNRDLQDFLGWQFEQLICFVFFLCLCLFPKEILLKWVDLVCCRVVGTEFRLFRHENKFSMATFLPPPPSSKALGPTAIAPSLCALQGVDDLCSKSLSIPNSTCKIWKRWDFWEFVCVLMRLRKGFLL